MSGPTLGERVSCGEKVCFLASPDAYGPGSAPPELRETHMSWVFLAADRVYKLKKPVRYPYLDFSTLAAREASCREEDRLNRRLAPWVYLGVARLTLEASGQLALQGSGETVDWLVVMSRLPDQRMLDRAIESGVVLRDEVLAVADLLADFYRRTARTRVTARDYVASFARQQASNRAVLADPTLGLSSAGLEELLARIDRVIEGEPELLAQRARDGRIVDGHGDLRPEHVCLTDPPVIIDCLEFNPSLRLVDPFDELAGLGMDCARLGMAWIGELLIRRCAESLGGLPPERLLGFYAAYRACLRARLALAHLLEAEVREPERWRPLATAYLHIARQALVSRRPPGARPATRLRGSGE